MPSEPSLELGVAIPWSVFECLISEWWRDSAKLTEVLISKEPPCGGVVDEKYSLVAKLICESIAYFRKPGFELDHTVRSALRALDSLNIADLCNEEIHFGFNDSKPIYIAGPHDVAAIMPTLVSNC